MGGDMTTREKALLLRLAAVEEVGEADLLLRRTLRDLGWTEGAISDAVARIREAVTNAA